MSNAPYKTIVCLGDSITCDWKTPSYVNFWQELCDQEYGANQVSLINAGINGETAQDGYYRTHRDIVERKPDLVTIMFGHNDAEPNRNVSPVLFANYIRKIVNYIQHHSPQTTIWILSPNGIGDAQFEKKYQPYLDQLQQVANDKNVMYVSL
ncbi:MAG TPA: SGNH/GDSL hydrolase family protein [Patescibacteria group bacterium]